MKDYRTDPDRRPVASDKYTSRRDDPIMTPPRDERAMAGDRYSGASYPSDRYIAPDPASTAPPDPSYTPPAERPVAPPATQPAAQPRTFTRPYDHREVVLDQPDAPVVERLEGPAAEPPVAERRFSLGATFLGWAVAAFFTFVFTVLALALLGAAATQADFINSIWTLEAGALANTTAVVFLISMFLAYLIGGYAAGRIALWDGLKHGSLIVVWPVLLTILAGILGAVAADNVRAYVPAGVDAASLTTGAIVMGLLSLLVMIAGGALGGRMGERYHKVDRSDYRRRTTSRGRPL